MVPIGLSPFSRGLALFGFQGFAGALIASPFFKGLKPFWVGK